MEYEQRVIIKFLAIEKVDAREIARRLRVAFGEDAYALRTVQFWMAEVRRGREDLHDEHRPGRPPLDHIDSRILALLDRAPFESARSMAEVLHVDHATILRHLHEKLGFKSYCVRWVPHLMSDELRATRKECAAQMIPYLEAARDDGWRHLVTGDESWFFITSTIRRMWSVVRDDVATIPRTDIATKKFMYTIMWNPSGFHVIDKLPLGAKMNSGHYTANVLQPLYEVFFPRGRKPRAKRLVVHVDNCSVHRSGATEAFMESHEMIRMPHPPYSPDLAPSDFYLFGLVKGKLGHVDVMEEDDLFEALDEILGSIPGEELLRVFETWLDRVRAVSDGDGDYILS
jgi:histone-lysine N-methyltransferase SETMAR